MSLAAQIVKVCPAIAGILLFILIIFRAMPPKRKVTNLMVDHPELMSLGLRIACDRISFLDGRCISRLRNLAMHNQGDELGRQIADQC